MSGSSGDEAAGRVRAWLAGWDSDPYMARETVVCGSFGEGPRLDLVDLRALLDEREQLREQLARSEAIRREWVKHDNLRRDRIEDTEAARDDATARAEQAEAEVERLKARLAEPIREAGSYRIGTDGDTADGFDWPYVQHLPCDQEIWSGRHANGAGLDVASLLSLMAAHHCEDEQQRQDGEEWA